MKHINYLKGVVKSPFFTFLYCCTALLLFAVSCEEDTDLDGDLQTPGSGVGPGYVDTFSLFTKTVRVDSIRSDQSFRMPLGDYRDPVFGVSKADLATSFELSITGANLTGSNYQFDSLVVSLAYGLSGAGGSFYSRKTGTGDVDLDEQTFRVYRLNEQFGLDDTIYSDGTVRNGFVKGTVEYDDNNPIGEATVKPRVGMNDSVTVGNETFAPHLRIKLNDDFGEDLMKAGVFGSQNALDEYLPGIVIVPENNFGADKGQILYIDPNSSISRMTLFYRDASGSDPIAEQLEFDINDDVVRFNLFEKDYIGTEVQQALQAGTSSDPYAGGRKKTYVQGLSGVRTEVQIPHLADAFAGKGDVVVNQAELILPKASSTGDKFPPITQFNIAALAEDGRLTVVADFAEGFGHLDGNLNENENRYRFNLTRQIQQILQTAREGGNRNFGFVVVPASEPVNAGRTVLNGFDPQDNRTPKLKITYTSLND